MVKYSERLCGFITVLGIVFLTTFFTLIAVGGYSALHSNYLLPLHSLNNVMWFLLIGGTFSLIAGTVGIIRKYFNGQRSLFATLVVISIPILVIAIFHLGFILTMTTPN